ncbi:hypothetical protein IC582_023285 [Cucumis melo]|uniref:Uncharacterized protein At3g27210-like n=2 Tax=Cucumis melo TaxID=3656 RepID=A0A1S3BEU1_CUCME|nr:uncharacterized protein At3g27210-like [Cucumis melo]KAA0034204.1 uncharacterized protein E6C27_scaffold65G002000 [Cucumis melo var. makuwa]
MGNCVLVRRDQKPDSKFKWSVGSGTVVNVNVSSNESDNKPEVWEKEIIGRLCSSPRLSSHLQPSSPPFGKGDEIFFDSQAWLDSDNDDFFSVNGDNTPSCGNTPLWRPNTIEAPLADPSSPKQRKKLLFELFQESFNREHGRSIANPTISNRHNIEVVIMEANDKKPISKSVKGNSTQSTPWCIPVPKLTRSLSLGEKKKRLLSPCRGGGHVHH